MRCYTLNSKFGKPDVHVGLEGVVNTPLPLSTMWYQKLLLILYLGNREKYLLVYTRVKHTQHS